MKNLIRLIYNPGAGTGEENAQQDIVSAIEAHGYSCECSSSKNKILKAIKPETALIVIAGGDGTIRKTILKLINKKIKFKRPIAILPYGTANNIANSLAISENIDQNINSWAKHQLKQFDVGQVLGLKKTNYFIESFGFGLFPKLMSVLKDKNTDHITTPEEEFKMAISEMINLTRNYEAVPVRIELDHEVIAQDCILLEFMNISSLGPRLKLSHHADCGDGYFDLILVSAAQRSLMENYLLEISEKGEAVFPIKPIRVKHASISWLGNDVHMDDQILENYHMTPLKVTLLESLLEMITTKT